MKNKMKALGMILAFTMVLFLATACDEGDYEGQGETQKLEASFTEQQQARLIIAAPPPELKYSLERKNLSKRLIRFNDENKVSYIYLISYGKVMGFYPIKGKVSSVNSKLTTGEQIVDDPFGAGHAGIGGKVVESPQLDGSYGTNGDAVFFFTTEDVYVEWNGEYMLCDQPLRMTTPPALIYVMPKEKR